MWWYSGWLFVWRCCCFGCSDCYCLFFVLLFGLQVGFGLVCWGPYGSCGGLCVGWLLCFVVHDVWCFGLICITCVAILYTFVCIDFGGVGLGSGESGLGGSFFGPPRGWNLVWEGHFLGLRGGQFRVSVLCV